MSPWWAFVDPGPHGDPGVKSVLARARAAKVPLVRAIRDAYAVMFEWNALGETQSGFLKLQQIKLTKPVFGFHGLIAPLSGSREPLAYPPEDQSRFMGGAYQIFIPGLTIGSSITLIG